MNRMQLILSMAFDTVVDWAPWLFAGLCWFMVILILIGSWLNDVPLDRGFGIYLLAAVGWMLAAQRGPR